MYYIIVIFTALITLIPIKTLYTAAFYITKVIFFFWTEKYKNVEDNYKTVLLKKLGRFPSDIELKNTINDNLKNYAMFNVEFLYLNKMVKKGAVPEIRGTEKLDESLKKGKGIIMCTLHFSNWDIAGLTISSHYDNVWAVADDLGGGYSKFIQETRGKYGIHIVLPNKNLKDAYRCLENNGILNVLVDRPVSPSEKGAVEVEFFGRKTYVASFAARLALKTGAALMLGCVIRENENFYGNPGEIIEYNITGNTDTDLQVITQEIMKHAEKLITAHPEQWYMFRRFWK
ncbi:MAG: lysophospholipid acyltransferase family protein [Candidatus Goldbacteria bacterium]|nr:lysophospholipid acyltransferase family protein [Candidatus Goldiibacteriota bacterium]